MPVGEDLGGRPESESGRLSKREKVLPIRDVHRHIQRVE